MAIEVVLALVAGVWIAVLLFVVSLCRAAKWSDDAMDVASGHASPERELRTLSLDDAAAILGIDPETLLAWEDRYGFPTSSASELRYSRAEVLALCDGLRHGASISAAVALARTQTRRRRPITGTARSVDRRGGGIAS
jgi:hypothetical protein